MSEENKCKRCGECCVERFKALGHICEHFRQEGSITACVIHDSDDRPEMCKGYICDYVMEDATK